MTDAGRQRIAIVGAGGRLGAMLARVYADDADVFGFNHAQLDLAEAKQLRSTLDPRKFDVLINCAAQTNVDRCETERAEAFAINADAPGVLAEICAAKGARMIHISTDYVFDGNKAAPYREEDEPKPISVYGESKLAGEQRVMQSSDRHLVARVSWVFGPDRPSFIDWIVQRAREHDRVEAVADKFSTPTYTLDIAQMLQPFLSTDAAGGILHIANRGECSWRAYGQHALDCCAAAGVPLRARTVEPIPLADMKNFIARRPFHTAMATARFERVTGETPRHWRDAVSDYIRSHVAA
jgi:dTDP-4-dehydrorhamnose reductase